MQELYKNWGGGYFNLNWLPIILVKFDVAGRFYIGYVCICKNHIRFFSYLISYLFI